MKTGEEILLEEVRAQYSRQLDIWTELNNKSQSFLQLNGLLLSVIFIGMGFVSGVSDYGLFSLLITSAAAITTSIIILAVPIMQREHMKETKVETGSDAEMEGKEKDIMLALINAYNIAQKDVIDKYKKRNFQFGLSVGFLIGGLFFLFLFIAVTVFFR